MTTSRWLLDGADVEATASVEGDLVVVRGLPGGDVQFTVRSRGDGAWLLEHGGRLEHVHASRAGQATWVHARGRVHSVVPARASRPGGAAPRGGPLVAPMTAKVQAVLIEQGEWVEAGATLVVLSAMKMQLQVRATVAGRVTRLAARVGDLVEGGAVLAEVEAAPRPGGTEGS